MSDIIKLLKLQLDSKYDFLKIRDAKRMVLQIFIYLMILFAATAGISFAFFKIFILGFALTKELMAIILVVTQAISLAFSVGNVISNFYLNRNNEFLMALPTTPDRVFISKLLLTYIDEVIANTLICLPLFLAIGFTAGGNNAFYISLLPLMLVLPFLPLALASLVSIPAMYVMKYLKGHNVLSITLILATVAVGVYGYASLLGKLSVSFQIVDKQIETVKAINGQIAQIGKHIPLYYPLADVFFDGEKIYMILLYILVCAVLMVVTALLLRRFYFKIAMSFGENSNDKPAKAGHYRQRSQVMTLLTKEVKSVFRSSGYVFQYFLFTLLMPFIVFSYDKLLTVIVVNQTGKMMIAGSHVMIVAIFAMLSNLISATALSREGSCFYLSKIVPVNIYVQVFSKLLFNALFTVGAVLVTMIMSLFYLNAVEVIIGSLAVIFASIGHIAYGIETDIKSPVLNWYSEDEITQVGKNVSKSIVVGLLVAVLMGFLIILTASGNGSVVPWLVLLLLGLAFCLYRVYRLILRINLQYREIEM